MRYPEMVKSNARYRGPMESLKFTNGVLDVAASIARLKEDFAARKASTQSLWSGMASHYQETIPEQAETLRLQAKAVKGGEL